MSDRSHPGRRTPSLAERYSSAAVEHARLRSPVIGPMGQRLIRALPFAGVGRVLDVGTGGGALVPNSVFAAGRYRGHRRRARPPPPWPLDRLSETPLGRQ